MHINKNNIFTHFKIQYEKKIISFYKIYINFPYLEETLKILKNLALKIYSTSNIISYVTFIIDYLYRDINLTILTIFYIVPNSSN